MIDSDFKKQVFREAKQWDSGLYYRLARSEFGGISLPKTPAVTQWIELGEIPSPACLALDCCGQLYFVDSCKSRLFRYDLRTGLIERIPCFGGGTPTSMLISKHVLWVLDPVIGVQGFARENLQLEYVLDQISSPVDLAGGAGGVFFVLDRESRSIYPFAAHGRPAGSSFGADQIKQPAAIAAGIANDLFVIDLDPDVNAFLHFSQKGDFLGTLGRFAEIGADFLPACICTDLDGSIFVGDGQGGGLYQFASDGSYLGQVSGISGAVNALACDRQGNIYVSTEKDATRTGLALLAPQQGYSLHKGWYYSKGLDSGIRDCRWHRLALEGEIPARTALEVYYFVSDDDYLRAGIDGILTSKDSQRKKKQEIDAKIPEAAWVGPERDPLDLLFREQTGGRYLWLKIVATSFDPLVTPKITAMTVYYPRISYLRYLPAIYQEDPVSSQFLERFLSLFESFFFDLETEIAGLHRYFDPRSNLCPSNDPNCRAQSDFLSWLASWLNLALEEQWPTDKKRQLIEAAYTLYRQKGTPAGISKLVEIYTGKTPSITEHSGAQLPMVLGRDLWIGVNTVVRETPIRGFRLGDDSILGKVALRDVPYDPEDPFLPLAYVFTVALDLSREEAHQLRDGLVKLLNAEKPAHTSYRLLITGAGGSGWTSVGINSRVDGYRAMIIGVDSILGANLISLDDGENCGKIGARSRIGETTILT